MIRKHAHSHALELHMHFHTHNLYALIPPTENPPEAFDCPRWSSGMRKKKALCHISGQTFLTTQCFFFFIHPSKHNLLKSLMDWLLRNFDFGNVQSCGKEEILHSSLCIFYSTLISAVRDLTCPPKTWVLTALILDSAKIDGLLYYGDLING